MDQLLKLEWDEFYRALPSHHQHFQENPHDMMVVCRHMLDNTQINLSHYMHALWRMWTGCKDVAGFWGSIDDFPEIGSYVEAFFLDRKVTFYDVLDYLENRVGEDKLILTRTKSGWMPYPDFSIDDITQFMRQYQQFVDWNVAEEYLNYRCGDVGEPGGDLMEWVPEYIGEQETIYKKQLKEDTIQNYLAIAMFPAWVNNKKTQPNYQIWKQFSSPRLQDTLTLMENMGRLPQHVKKHILQILDGNKLWVQKEVLKPKPQYGIQFPSYR